MAEKNLKNAKKNWTIFKWFNIAVFEVDRTIWQDFFCIVEIFSTVANLFCNIFYAFELKKRKKCYWNCCSGPSNELVLQIGPHPNSCQYPLINYLDPNDCTDPNDPNYDPNDPNYDPNDDIEANPVDECENKVIVQYHQNIPQEKREIKSSKKRKKLEDELSELDAAGDNKVNVAKKLAKKPKKAATLADFLDGLDETKFTCYYCDKMFKNRKFLNEHFKKHLDSNGNFPCKHCNIVKSSYYEISTHIRRSHNPGFCKECNKSFHGQTSLARHLKVVCPKLLFCKHLSLVVDK